MSKIYETEVAGRPLSLEFGKVAGLANGSVIVRYGDTVVISCATASDKPRDGIDFFPLSIDYEEKMYAVGKIPGGFNRREGKPSDHAILTSRVIDRPMRPLFPKDLRNDVSIVSTVVSVDQDNSPEFCAMIGSSIAVSVSDIPFNGPVAAVYVGMIDGEFIINPNVEQREESDLNLVVSGSAKKVVMIEAGANEVSETDMYNAIMQRSRLNRRLTRMIRLSETQDFLLYMKMFMFILRINIRRKNIKTKLMKLFISSRRQ